jgi:hypothetical protein
MKSADGKKRKAKKPAAKSRDISESYNAFKEYEGKQYTGMKIGRGHTWKYDAGEWKEKKIRPDEWQITYKVNKRRKGRAPEGSGVPVGTEYHWYILSHQFVKKLDANTYSTEMTGLKFKLAHKRADKESWSASDKARKKHLIRILENIIVGLYDDISLDKIAPLPAKKKPATRKKAKKEKVTEDVAAEAPEFTFWE